MRERQKVIEDFRKRLEAIQSQRHLRPIESLDAPSWISFEIQFMWGVINEYRFAQHKTLIAYSKVADADRLAAGHSDYTSKFALYCADLAVDE